MQIVSLLPSATEIVYALGLEPAATSHECDYPSAATTQPAANRSRINSSKSSEEINRQVISAQHTNGVYELDHELLRSLKPDLIITQGSCDVCAVDTSLVSDAVDRLGLESTVIATHPHSLEEIIMDIEEIGAATGATNRAAELSHNLHRRIDTVDRLTSTDNRRVVVLDWLNPIMAAGHWVPEMIELVGCTYGLELPGEPSQVQSWRAVREFNPEVLILAPCGFEPSQTHDNLRDVTSMEGWSSLEAVQSNQVWVMDGHHYMNRPGPRIVDSLEYIAGILYPNRFKTPPAEIAQPVHLSVQ